VGTGSWELVGGDLLVLAFNESFQKDSPPVTVVLSKALAMTDHESYAAGQADYRQAPAASQLALDHAARVPRPFALQEPVIEISVVCIRCLISLCLLHVIR
jgi:hypothetical protein